MVATGRQTEWGLGDWARRGRKAWSQTRHARRTTSAGRCALAHALTTGLAQSDPPGRQCQGQERGGFRARRVMGNHRRAILHPAVHPPPFSMPKNGRDRRAAGAQSDGVWASNSCMPSSARWRACNPLRASMTCGRWESVKSGKAQEMRGRGGSSTERALLEPSSATLKTSLKIVPRSARAPLQGVVDHDAIPTAGNNHLTT